MMLKIIVGLFLFFLVATIGILPIMYTQEIVGDAVIGNISAVSLDLVENQTFKDNISQIAANYQSAKFNYDYLFILMWMILEISLITLAVMSPKLPNWNFLTFLFFGTLMLSFSYSFVMDIATWIIQELILDVFSSDVTYMPFYNYFNSNQVIIVFINFIIVLGVNKIFGRPTMESPFMGG